MDRYLIAPFEVGLEIKASHCILDKYTKGCFMARKYNRRVDTVDETGKRHGMLTVVKITESKAKRRAPIRGAFWECICDCGNTCIRSGGHLRAGRNQSCGCLKERTIENTGINNLMFSYRRHAHERGKWFNLSKESFYKLIKGNCHYCGKEPSNILKRSKTDKIQIIYNAIDRAKQQIRNEKNGSRAKFLARRANGEFS